MATKRRAVARRAPPPPTGWKAVPIFWRNVIYISGGISAIAAAITALPKASDVIEPVAPAHRGYVRDTAKQQIDPVQKTTETLLHWKLEDQRTRAKQEEGAWGLQLQREKDPAARSLIQQQLDRAVAEQKQIDERLKVFKSP